MILSLHRVFVTVIALSALCCVPIRGGLAFCADPPPFHLAAARGDLDTMQRLLNETPDLLSAPDDDGNTALHHAAWNGQTGIARFLLERGVSPDIRQTPAKNPNDGWTPLFQACANGQIEMVKLLLAAGAKPDARDTKEGATPLHAATQNGHIEAVRLLLAAGVPADIRRTVGRVTPLEMASYYNRLEIVRLLLAKGADPNARVYEGNSPLHQAARNSNTDVMLELVQAGANRDSRRDDGQTPLHYAAAQGQVNAVKLLLGIGADASAVAKNGDTPLAAAQHANQGGTAAVLQQHLDALKENDQQAELLKAMNGGQVLKPGDNEKLVYLSNFGSEVPGDEWTSTPNGASFRDLHLSTFANGVRFLGDLGAQELHLSLSKMPSHTRVTVVVTLHLLGTWDGNLPNIGPDIWEAGIVGGPTLLRTSFCTVASQVPKVPLQAFPGNYPSEAYPARTGAVANNTLHWAATTEATTRNDDATYKLAWTFAHSNPYLVLRFAGRNLEDVSNESWGLSRVEVRVSGASTGKSQGKSPRKPSGTHRR